MKKILTYKEILSISEKMTDDQFDYYYSKLTPEMTQTVNNLINKGSSKQLAISALLPLIEQ